MQVYKDFECGADAKIARNENAHMEYSGSDEPSHAYFADNAKVPRRSANACRPSEFEFDAIGMSGRTMEMEMPIKAGGDEKSPIEHRSML